MWGYCYTAAKIADSTPNGKLDVELKYVAIWGGSFKIGDESSLTHSSGQVELKGGSWFGWWQYAIEFQASTEKTSFYFGWKS